MNFQRQIDSQDASGAQGGSFLQQSSYAKTSTMETPDDSTVIARTDGPDATWLGVPLGPFGWITSPEAIAEFGDRWRDEPTNVELSSGTGMTIHRSYDPDIRLELERNPNFWKLGADGQPLPYFDSVTFASLFDRIAIEAAYRSREISIGEFPLTSLQVQSLSNDFPDHPTGNVPYGFTIVTGLFNFNRDWDGWDGLGNRYLDRRFCQAMHLAVDRNQMIDTVYLGSAKVSGQEDIPWFKTYWSIPEEELLTVPGYRPDREADIREARALLDASGYDQERPIQLLGFDLWEQSIRVSSRLRCGCTAMRWGSMSDSTSSRPWSSCSAGSTARFQDRDRSGPRRRATSIQQPRTTTDLSPEVVGTTSSTTMSRWLKWRGPCGSPLIRSSAGKWRTKRCASPSVRVPTMD